MNPNFGQQKSTLTAAQIALLSNIQPSAIPFISTMNQNVSITANPTFNSLTLTTGFPQPTSLNLNAGTAASPTLHYASDLTAGIYHPSAHTLSIAVNSADALTVSPTFTTSYIPLNVVPVGSQAAPSLQLGSAATGFYLTNSTDISVTCGNKTVADFANALTTFYTTTCFEALSEYIVGLSPYQNVWNNGSVRWNIGLKNSETGANAGADWYISSCTDAGANLAVPITVTRSTGNVVFCANTQALTASVGQSNDGLHTFEVAGDSTFKQPTATVVSANVLATQDSTFTGGSYHWSGTNWTVGSSQLAHTVTAANTATLSSPAFVSGTTYLITVSFNSTSASLPANYFTIRIGTASTSNLGTITGASSGIGEIVVANGTSMTIVPSSTWTGYLSSITVQSVTASTPAVITFNNLSAACTSINSTEASSTYVGLNSGLSQVQSASYNSAFGTNSMTYGGYQCSAFGYGALYKTLSSYSSAFGYNALTASTTGIQNNSFGYASLAACTTGFSNSGFGSQALGSLTTGNANCAFGYNSGSALTTGTNSIFIGSNSTTSLNSVSYSIAIGDTASVSASNQTVIGCPGHTTVTQLLGQLQMPAGTVAAPAHSFVTATGNGMWLPGTATLAFSIGGVSAGFIANSSYHYSTFHGYQAGNGLLTVGDLNSAFGYQAGQAITSGTNNSLFGVSAGGAITSGTQNTCYGVSAGSQISTGTTHTLLGMNAGQHVSTGSGNTLVGYNSATTMTTDTNCTIVGTSSGTNYNGATQCIHLGYNNAGSGATATNEIVIGNGLSGLGSNTMMLGGSSITNSSLYGALSLPSQPTLMLYSTATQALTTPGTVYTVQFPTSQISQNLTNWITVSGTNNLYFQNPTSSPQLWFVSYQIPMNTASSVTVVLTTWLGLSSTANGASTGGRYGNVASTMTLNNNTYPICNSTGTIVQIPAGSYMVVSAQQFSSGGALSIGNTTTNFAYVQIRQL